MQSAAACTMVEDGTTALVPFSHAAQFVDPLGLDERVFTVRDVTIKIKQEMKRDGRGGTSLGFGAAVYPSAILLTHFLDNHYPSRNLAGKTVLELGCGVGMCSIAACMCGAGKVIATDGDERSVELTLENIEKNRHAFQSEAQIFAEKLIWADKSDTARVADILGPGGVDLIIGSDIAACPYAEALPLLLECLLTFCGPNTTIIMTHKDRNVVEKSFWSMAEKHFVVTSLPRSLIHPDFRDDLGLHIKRMRLK